MKHHYYQQIKNKKVKRSFEDEVRTKPPVKVELNRTVEEWQEIMREARRKNG